jgi:hypothetical protein
VGQDDVVYDLGSGDGRIVITAAREYGARGVGVEIDPRLVAESRRQAQWAGVADRVQFLQQNLFDADLRPATVVTLYLSPEINARLRPKLLRELRPGARVVSHRFDMGDWIPQRELRLEVAGSAYVLYLFVISEGASAARSETSPQNRLRRQSRRASSLLRCVFNIRGGCGHAVERGHN